MTVQEDLKDILDSGNYTWTSPAKPQILKLQELQGGLRLRMIGGNRSVIVKSRSADYVSFGDHGNNVYIFPVVIIGETDDDAEALFVKIKSIVDAYHLTPFTVNSNDYNFMKIFQDQDNSNDSGSNPFVFDCQIQLGQLLTTITRSG